MCPGGERQGRLSVTTESGVTELLREAGGSSPINREHLVNGHFIPPRDLGPATWLTHSMVLTL